MPEQQSFNFHEATPPVNPSDSQEAKYNFAEREECPNCGSLYESQGACFACQHNEKKAEWLKEHNLKINEIDPKN